MTSQTLIQIQRNVTHDLIPTQTSRSYKFATSITAVFGLYSLTFILFLYLNMWDYKEKAPYFIAP